MEDDTIFTVTRKELKQILNVTDKALQHIITRKQLESRLEPYGYKIVKQYKIGRSNAYDLKEIEICEWDMLQYRHNIKKDDEHILYSFIRLTNMNEPRSKLLKDNDINISNTTAGRYDKILIDEKAMQEDKQVYYKVGADGQWEEITKEGYNAFWVECQEYKYILSLYRSRLRKNEITIDTYDLMTTNLYNTIERFKGYMVIKFKTYKEAENTKRVLDMIRAKNKSFL